MENYKNYIDFINRRKQIIYNDGMKPIIIHDWLFDFQKYCVEKSLLAGRYAIFEDCGLGKTAQIISWCDNVTRQTNKPVLIICPLAVNYQFVKEGEKFGVDIHKSSDGKVYGKINITNYEKLHMFNSNDFVGVVCDESSILKNNLGKTKTVVTRFMKNIKYRLLATATAAPNDYPELGTSSEALGYTRYMDMLDTFFRNTSNDKNPQWNEPKWVLKGHAINDFFRWLCSWSLAVRKPSDLGFDDSKFILPKLIVNQHEVNNRKNFDGWMFPKPANTLSERRQETKQTLAERCELAAEKALNHKSSVLWCHLDDESDLLEKLIPNSKQVNGKMKDEKKEEILIAFQKSEIPYLIIKPKIGGFGLNWQHVSHCTYFPTDSYEQYYQAIRREYRFGQKSDVTVDLIYSQGQIKVIKNLLRKSLQAEKMFEKLVFHMNDVLKLDRKEYSRYEIQIPSFLK